MGRKRYPGLRARAGIWHIEKQIFGRKIHESTGTGDLKTAQLILARRIEEVRMAKVFGYRPRRVFRDAAARFLEEDLALRSIADYAWHLKQLDAYIGGLALEQVHLGTLKPFIEARQKAGVPLETRKVLLGHRNGDITSHYSAPELAELLEAANRVCEGKSGKTPALMVLKQRAVNGTPITA